MIKVHVGTDGTKSFQVYGRSRVRDNKGLRAHARLVRFEALDCAHVGFSILLYGLLAAVLIAVVGTAFPSWLIAKIRPAEVMRTE